MTSKPAYEELEQELKTCRQEVKKLRQLIENLNEVLYMLDLEARITYVSPNIEKLAGYLPKEIIGRKFTDFVHPDDLADRIHYFQKIISGEGITTEYRYLIKNGETVWVMTNARPTFEGKEIVGIQGMLVDITERRQTEKELFNTKQRFDFALQATKTGLWDWNIQTGEVVFNEQWATMVGYSLDELRPLSIQTWMNLCHPDDLKESNALIEKHFRNESEIYECEARMKHKDGSWIWIMDRGKILEWDESGSPLRMIGTHTEITKRKKAEQEKDRLQAQLRQSQKMEAIGTLAGGIAHDFNNILSSVLGYTELSIDEVEKGSLLHQNLSQVLTAGNRAKDLIKQILAFSRKEEQEFTPTPIVPLLKEALKMLRSMFPSSIEIKKNISIEKEIVYAEPTQLHQMIVNLATNAKQAMSDEGGILEVTVETVSFDENIGKKYPDMAPGNYVQITVSDTGCGISEQYMDRIFEPYFTTSKTGTGTGLGLSVVHGIVKSHSGHITVYSEPGEGTTFYVFLPSAEQEISRDISTVQVGKELPTGTESILLVEDEKPIIDMQQQILETLGYRVTSRTSSVEVLEAFRANPYKFDLIVTDITMPNMTGDRLALKAKEIRPDIPVILCTGFSEKINDQQSKDLGIEGFLMKPVTKKDMAEAVRKVLDGK